MFNKILTTTLCCCAIFSSALASSESDQQIIDRCIGSWKNSPFKKGTQNFDVIRPNVKVFGIGNDSKNSESTKQPRLVLVKPSVNVLGKSVTRLMNPNGWYCLKANVNVLGKAQIEAHCKAHLASASDEATVLAANETEGGGGVTVLGSTRIKRIGCGTTEE